jgi:hypothetical protein
MSYTRYIHILLKTYTQANASKPRYVVNAIAFKLPIGYLKSFDLINETPTEKTAL